MLKTSTPRRQRGLSLVELMVGVVVGMFLVAGASSLFVNHLSNSRRLLTEARLNEDLRAVSDLVTRDLRRAGFWNNALLGTVAGGASSTTTPNAYRAVAASAVAASSALVTYGFSRDVTENNTLNDNERFGFQRAQENGVGVIQMKVGVVGGVDNWQTVTDPNTIDIRDFSVTPSETTVDIRDACARTCLGTGCPTIKVRHYLVTLTGRAVRDPAVSRTLASRVRVRNDEVNGVCPA